MDSSRFEYISFQKFINADLWSLQVIQEVYAFALDIPLRIFQRNEAELFWDKATDKSADFKRRFPSQAAFDQFATFISQNPVQGLVQLVNEEQIWQPLLARDQETWWVTQQSNGHPLCQMFIEHRYWRWWEFFYYYYQLVLSHPQSIFDYPKAEKNSLHVSFQSIPDNSNLILLAGPVWKPAAKATGEYFESEHVEPIIKRFFDWLNQVPDDATFHNSLYEKGLFLLRGISRYPVFSSDLVERLKQVADALSCLFQMEVPTESELHRCDYVGLAEWSVFAIVELERLWYAPKYRALRERRMEDGTLSVYYRLDHSLRPGQPTGQKGSSWVTTVWPLNDETSVPHLLLNHNHPYGYNGSSDLSRLLLPLAIADTPEIRTDLLSGLECALSRFLGRLATEKHHGRTEVQLALRAWLNDHFGILTSVGQEAAETVNRVSDRLCRLVGRSLIADIVTLYRYDYGSRELDTNGLFYTGSQQKDWEKTMGLVMKKAAHDPSEREHSIAYRAVDQAKTQFTRRFDQTLPDEDAATPSDKPLLPVPENLRSACSAIAVPVSVYGRPWGTLEVLGFRPYQFRWDNRSLVEEFADILSPFFYHQWFLARLDNLNSVASNTGGNLTDKYNIICKNLAGLFLSYGAALWVLDPVGEGRFTCMGCYNHPALSQALQNDLEPPSYKITDKHSMLSQALKKMQVNVQYNKLVWWHGVVGDDLLNDMWRQLPHNQNLLEFGIRSKSIIPVTSQENDQGSEKIIAVISLYNQTEAAFNSRWRHLVTFVTRYTALLLGAIRAQHDWERRARGFIAHEMKTQVDNIKDRTEALMDLLRQAHGWLDDQKKGVQRFLLVISRPILLILSTSSPCLLTPISVRSCAKELIQCSTWRAKRLIGVNRNG